MPHEPKHHDDSAHGPGVHPYHPFRTSLRGA